MRTERHLITDVIKICSIVNNQVTLISHCSRVFDLAMATPLAFMSAGWEFRHLYNLSMVYTVCLKISRTAPINKKLRSEMKILNYVYLKYPCWIKLFLQQM